MARVDHTVIPARFLVTLGHLIGTLLVFDSMQTNVYGTLGEDASKDAVEAAKTQMQSALSMALVCFALDFVSMLVGFSIFISVVNLLQTAFHFFGAVAICQFITAEWDYRSLWYIVALTNVPTAIAELVVLVAIFGLKLIHF